MNKQNHVIICPIRNEEVLIEKSNAIRYYLTQERVNLTKEVSNGD
jgi:hypothetical protein